MTMVHLCHLKVLKKNLELRQITLHILVVCKLSKATYVKQKCERPPRNESLVINVDFDVLMFSNSILYALFNGKTVFEYVH